MKLIYLRKNSKTDFPSQIKEEKMKLNLTLVEFSIETLKPIN